MVNDKTVNDHHSHYHLCNMKCISWSAILLGALVAVGLGFLANLFSLAVGLTAFPLSPEGKEAFAAIGFVGLVVLAIFTMYIAGWVAGFLGRSYCFKRKLGELYGFGAWSLALIITLLLTAHTSQLLSQRSYVVSRNAPSMILANDLTVNVNAAAEAVTKRSTSPAASKASTAAGLVTFGTFFIFFIGAVSAMVGGRRGIRYKKNQNPENCPVCK